MNLFHKKSSQNEKQAYKKKTRKVHQKSVQSKKKKKHNGNAGRNPI